MESSVPQSSQDLSQVREVFVERVAKYDNVVEVDEGVWLQVRPNNLVE